MSWFKQGSCMRNRLLRHLHYSEVVLASGDCKSQTLQVHLFSFGKLS